MMNRFSWLETGARIEVGSKSNIFSTLIDLLFYIIFTIRNNNSNRMLYLPLEEMGVFIQRLKTTDGNLPFMKLASSEYYLQTRKNIKLTINSNNNHKRKEINKKFCFYYF